MIIPKRSKVQFKLHGVGGDVIVKTCESDSNIEIVNDAITIIDNGLFCTDSIKPVEQVDEKIYIINVCLQDAYCVKDDILYSSVTDAY